MEDYRAFLESKFRFSPAAGIEVDAAEMNPALKPMTQDIARWMLAGGRRAFFGDFGLHKTATQLEVHRLHGAHGAGLRLQFDIVDRAIERWSNPDDEISDPFGGLFTVPYRALKLGRRGHAVELNPEYFDDGVPYLRAAEEEQAMPSLFDLASEPEAAD